MSPPLLLPYARSTFCANGQVVFGPTDRSPPLDLTAPAGSLLPAGDAEATAFFDPPLEKAPEAAKAPTATPTSATMPSRMSVRGRRGRTGCGAGGCDGESRRSSSAGSRARLVRGPPCPRGAAPRAVPRARPRPLQFRLAGGATHCCPERSPTPSCRRRATSTRLSNSQPRPSGVKRLPFTYQRIDTSPRRRPLSTARGAGGLSVHDRLAVVFDGPAPVLNDRRGTRALTQVVGSSALTARHRESRDLCRVGIARYGGVATAFAIRLLDQRGLQAFRHHLALGRCPRSRRRGALNARGRRCLACGLRLPATPRTE